MRPKQEVAYTYDAVSKCMSVTHSAGGEIPQAGARALARMGTTQPHLKNPAGKKKKPPPHSAAAAFQKKITEE